MKIAIILGTRPEITKMAPLIKIYQQRRADFFLLHTGQHYSYQMDKVFFDQLKLPRPQYNIDVGSGSLADHLSDYLFAPTPKAKQILLGEGVDEKKVFVTGNTIVDTIFQNLELAKSGKDMLKDLNIEEGQD